MNSRNARFSIGQVVKHRIFPFRGVIFDVDPEFANTDEWYEAIPADVRPRKDQPFYHLLAENSEAYYVAGGVPRIALGDVKITKSQPAERVYGAAGEKADQERKESHD